MESEQTAQIEQWAIVELMGHGKIAGRISKNTEWGVSLIQIDVPAMEPPEPMTQQGYALTSKPAYSRMFGQAAIYSVTPAEKDTVIEFLKQHYWGHMTINLRHIPLAEGDPDDEGDGDIPL